MKKSLLCILAVLLIGLAGWVQQSNSLSKNPSYIDTLHRSWLEIADSISNDSSLTQSDMNEGSGIAVLLARKEADYWSSRLLAKGIAIPAWNEHLEEIISAPSEFEGGSAAPLTKHMEMIDYLLKTIDEMRKICRD